MSVESQAILAGHVPVERIVRLLKSEVGNKVVVRDMQRPEYKLIEFQRLDGTWHVFNVFLDSWAAADHADVYDGPSTFMTAEYTPMNFPLLRRIAAAIGGMARKTPADPWIELEPARL